MGKNARLKEKHGLREGDRIQMRYRGSSLIEEVDDDGARLLSGTVYQIYELFVVIATRYGTRHSYLWSDFLKWRTK